jgi:hypothetical protein
LSTGDSGFFCDVPVEPHGDSGWIATTTNTFWVLAFALVSLVPIKKILSASV